MNPITLTLSQQEVQTILNSLAERPFREVHEVVHSVLSQANNQAEGGQAGLRSVKPAAQDEG